MLSKHLARNATGCIVIIGVVLCGSVTTASAAQHGHEVDDSLYVGDTGDDTVKQFDARTGAFVATFSGANLHGPRGILHLGDFLVANQNQGLPVAGEIERFSADGVFRAPLVPQANNPNAPFTPRGIILSPDRRTLYVADLGPDDPDCVGSAATPCGAVKAYDVSRGPTARFIGNLDFSAFTSVHGEFRPRGLVFGPDRELYVSVFSEADPVVGYVLRYNLRTGKVVVVGDYQSTADACSRNLHRPEGLSFGPDHRLYVTSFRANRLDVDRVLVFEHGRGDHAGQCADHIDLYQAGQARAFAQALLFGPRDALFVPISGGDTDIGAVRRYDVRRKTYTNFIAPASAGGHLLAPWYLSFGATNPVTLEYED